MVKGGSAALEKFRSKRLSDSEAELLKAAAERGEFHIMGVPQIPGPWVRVGGRDFIDENDPAVAAGYFEAFQTLCGRQYVSHQGKDLFVLTGTGFNVTRKLTAKG